MKAIRTRFMGPTNLKGSRISATDGDKVIYVPYDHALNIDGNHALACEAFRLKMNWVGSWKAGWFNSDCYHVRVE